MHDVALIIGDLSEGGAQRVVTTLANAWTEAGHRVAIITIAGAELDYFDVSSRVTRLAVGQAGASPGPLVAIATTLRRIRGLRALIKKTRAPVAVAFVGSTNVLAILATRGLGVRVVISERNDPARQSLGRIWDALRRWLYRHADLVTANSYAALTTLQRFVPVERLAYAPNPLSMPSSLPPRSVCPVILNVGRLHPQKGQDILISAFASATAELPEWRLAIAGSGDLEMPLRAQAAALGVESRVDLLGLVDPWPHYARAAIFALPSRFEGTPNALLEAMSLGVPPVVSNASGGPLEFVEHGVTGLVVPPDDAIALATTLNLLIQDEGLRARLGEAARARVEECAVAPVLAQWEGLIQLRSSAATM